MARDTAFVETLRNEPEIARSVSDLPRKLRLLHFPIGGTPEDALSKLAAAKPDFAAASGKTGVPVTVLLAAAFRETVCYGVEDLLFDWLPGRSKGIMQIKAATAQQSLLYFHPDSTVSRWRLEALLQLRRAENIYYAALTLLYWADQYRVDLASADDGALSRVFSSYNCGRIVEKPGPYGRAALTYYRAFSRHREVL